MPLSPMGEPEKGLLYIAIACFVIGLVLCVVLGGLMGYWGGF